MAVVAQVAQRLLAAPDLDAALPAALEQLGRAMGASRCYLYRNRPGEGGKALASLAEEWCEPGVASQGPRASLRDLPTVEGPYREYGLPLSRGEVVARPTEEFGEPVRTVLAATGTLSVLCVPIFLGRRWWGSLGVDDCRSARRWTADEADVLRSAGGVIGEAAERHRAEGELRESESKFRELFENASDLYWSIDLDGRFASVNRSLAELLGYGVTELVGRSWEEIIPEPDQREIVRRAMREKLELGKSRTRYEVRLRRRDGSFVSIEVSSRLLTREGRAVGIHGSGRDVSERRRLEEQLRQAVKLEAVGRLAASIAHEFNHLLAAITGYGEHVMSRLRAGDPLRAEVGEILRAGERAADLTRELLAFGRQQEARPSRVDLNELIVQRLPTLRRIVGEEVVVVDLTEARVGRIEADPSLVEQVLVNLFVNARDAMPEGGRIEVSTAVAEAAEILRRGLERVGHERYVRLSIRDTGHGIDSGTMARIFEPFFSTRERGKGSGLGLSTVYGIVKQCEGFIFADSHPGQGSVFLVYLPQVESAAPRRPSGELRLTAPPTPEATRDELVLLVEDEDLVRNLAEQILGDRGYRVVAAANATDALEAVGRLEREIDLLVTDIVMPGPSGLDLAQRLQKRLPRLRVLFISGYSDSPLLRAGLAREGSAFLQKPFTADALERRVRELLDA